MTMSQKRKHRNGSGNKTIDSDARLLYGAISELVRVYQFRDRRRICYYDVSVTQCHALSALLGNESMTLNALAAELHLDKSTASRLVDSLEDKGYVARYTDPDDARALSLRATRKGQEIHEKVVQDLIDETGNLAADYDHDTREATAEFIQRYAEAAARRFGMDSEA